MTEFIYCPAPGASQEITPKVRTAVFGDGYQQRVGDGINTLPRKWSLTFTRRTADIDAIEEFLTDAGGIESFSWTPPSGLPGLWICKSWVRNLPHTAAQSISATFEEVFGD